MLNRNILIFIFIIATFLGRNAEATLAVYKQFYIPALTGADDSPRLQVLPITYQVNAETMFFEAPLFPYYSHYIAETLGEKGGKDEEGFNINPASSMNLKIIPYDNAKNCSIGLDVSGMKLPEKQDIDMIKTVIEDEKGSNISDSDITNAQVVVVVLEKVVESLEKNLQARNQEFPDNKDTPKSCNFSIKGLEKHSDIKQAIPANSSLFKTIINGKEK